jgi:hypothetical protein
LLFLGDLTIHLCGAKNLYSLVFIIKFGLPYRTNLAAKISSLKTQNILHHRGKGALALHREKMIQTLKTLGFFHFPR